MDESGNVNPAKFINALGLPYFSSVIRRGQGCAESSKGILPREDMCVKAAVFGRCMMSVALVDSGF